MDAGFRPLFLEPDFHEAVFELNALDAVGEAFAETLVKK